MFISKPVLELAEAPPRKRVFCFVDGFNLYHALDFFEDGVSERDKFRYRKYRWLSLRTLAQCYVRPQTETLVGVNYFTTYAHWREDKVFRHSLYVRAQQAEGTHVIFGKFKNKQITCKAGCGGMFSTWEEKQTDVNLARSIMELAYLDVFDRAIVISGDSDQVPTISFVRDYFTDKTITVVVPIGRAADELKAVAHTTEKMSEAHLQRAQMPEKVQCASTGEWLLRPPKWNTCG
jgi:uncharacterized LabA/DUF88 family protein